MLGVIFSKGVTKSDLNYNFSDIDDFISEHNIKIIITKHSSTGVELNIKYHSNPNFNVILYKISELDDEETRYTKNREMLLGCDYLIAFIHPYGGYCINTLETMNIANEMNIEVIKIRAHSISG